MKERVIMIAIGIISFALASARLEENKKDITTGTEDFICIAMQVMSIILILIEIFMK